MESPGAILGITPEQWERVKALFHAVVDLKPDQHTELLDRVCRDDQRRRAVAERRLEGAEASPEFLEAPFPRSRRRL